MQSSSTFCVVVPVLQEQQTPYCQAIFLFSIEPCLRRNDRHGVSEVHFSIHLVASWAFGLLMGLWRLFNPLLQSAVRWQPKIIVGEAKQLSLPPHGVITNN